jgi:UDP-glucose 4-epimerase
MIELHSPIKCAVLGAGGFIGTNLLMKLKGLANFQVTAFSKRNNTIDPLNDVEWIKGDFESTIDLEPAVQGKNLIIHLISATNPSTSNDKIIEDLNGTVAATIRLLELCRKHHVGHIIFLSSGGTVYGSPTSLPISENAETNPINSYGISKLLIEKYLLLYEHLYGIKSIILRVSNPYGPFQENNKNQGVIRAFLSNSINEKPLELWGTGSAIRDYIYIDDVINAIILSALYDGSERIFNIGSGQGISLNELIERIKVISQSKIEIVQKMGRPVDVPVNVLNIDRAKVQLKWKPNISFDDGLKLTHSWLLNYHQKNP